MKPRLYTAWYVAVRRLLRYSHHSVDYGRFEYRSSKGWYRWWSEIQSCNVKVICYYPGKEFRRLYELASLWSPCILRSFGSATKLESLHCTSISRVSRRYSSSSVRAETMDCSPVWSVIGDNERSELHSNINIRTDKYQNEQYQNINLCVTVWDNYFTNDGKHVSLSDGL